MKSLERLFYKSAYTCITAVYSGKIYASILRGDFDASLIALAIAYAVLTYFAFAKHQH